ncbi:DUF4124 domain-containing protein [Guyparkeria sp. 1SP6A2]|nr:DUF4124 domain-containing protein [Guyparkeria sp. 1SP6A2]
MLPCHRLARVALIVAMLPIFSAQSSAQAAEVTYRWVNNQGHTQLSDTLPTGARAEGYQVVDPSTGQVLREVPPRKTAQQKAREAAEREAAERARRQAEETARHDQILLSLYGSVSDIERARDQRLTRLDAHIRQTERSIERMKGMLERHKDDEGYARDLENLKGSLVELRNERQAIEDRFEADIQRFRALNSNG